MRIIPLTHPISLVPPLNFRIYTQAEHYYCIVFYMINHNIVSYTILEKSQV
jgi:hypothetical protein